MHRVITHFGDTEHRTNLRLCEVIGQSYLHQNEGKTTTNTKNLELAGTMIFVVGMVVTSTIRGGLFGIGWDAWRLGGFIRA